MVFLALEEAKMCLDAVGLVCRDPQSSADFFNVLGIDIKRFEDSEHWEGSTKSGVRIMLDSFELIKKINPDYSEPKNNSMILAFKQDTPQAVDDLVKRLSEAGFSDIVKEPWDAFWGQRYACVKDPNGHQVDIFANL